MLTASILPVVGLTLVPCCTFEAHAAQRVDHPKPQLTRAWYTIRPRLRPSRTVRAIRLRWPWWCVGHAVLVVYCSRKPVVRCHACAVILAVIVGVGIVVWLGPAAGFVAQRVGG